MGTYLSVEGRYRGRIVAPMIDPGAREPVYLQLADILTGQIESGELPVGRTIPSEKTMQERYGVGRGTARKAVMVLRERGLVDTVPQARHVRLAAKVRLATSAGRCVSG